MPSGMCRVARWFRVWVLAVFGLMVFGLTAGAGMAQSAVDGAIGGRVVDQRGDSVAGAQISVKSAATGVVQTATSGVDGAFLVARVVPGSYEVVITAAGFRAVAEAVTVEPGAVANADARLDLEEVTTMLSVDAAPVSVPGGAPVPEATAPLASELQGDEVTTSDRVELLPVDGRRWQSFALLLPGVNAAGGTESGSAVSFRGLAVTQNSSEIDGASDDQSFGSVARGTGGGAGREAEEPDDSGGESGAGGDGARAQYGRHAGAAYTFAQGAVQEFRIRAGGYSALDGHAAGGVVTTVSKSGTNVLHGSGFYLARDSAWGATNPFSLVTHYTDGVVTSGFVKPEDLRQQFGGSVGGPVRLPAISPAGRAKLFYFATVGCAAAAESGGVVAGVCAVLCADGDAAGAAGKSRRLAFGDECGAELSRQPDGNGGAPGGPGHRVRQAGLGGDGEEPGERADEPGAVGFAGRGAVGAGGGAGDSQFRECLWEG